MIESESYGKKTAFDGGIAPSANLGGWVKVQNGVPVIINDFEAAMQSDLYNVDTNAGGATANDEITTSEVTIIAGEGNVTIDNAGSGSSHSGSDIRQCCDCCSSRRSRSSC